MWLRGPCRSRSISLSGSICATRSITPRALARPPKSANAANTTGGYSQSRIRPAGVRLTFANFESLAFNRDLGRLVVHRLTDSVLVDEVPIVGYAHSGSFRDLDFAVFVDGINHVAVAIEVDGRVRRL